jgi:hypothetical protein
MNLTVETVDVVEVLPACHALAKSALPAAEVGDAHAPGRTFCRARCFGYPPTRNAQATAPWRATFTTGSRLTRQWSPRSPGV